MKLTKKLVLVSASALLTVAPVLPALTSVTTVAAAKTTVASKVKKISGSVVATRNGKFVSANGKKTHKPFYKSAKYRIWAVKKLHGKTYYAIQSDLAYFLPASATKKSVKLTKKAVRTTKKVTKKTTKKAVAATGKYKLTLKKPVKFYTRSGQATTFLGNKSWKRGWLITVYKKPVTLKGVKYYKLAPNVYVKATNISKVSVYTGK
ncbi:MAG: SLAP domain-containing protein [Lactobacillus sp.]|nr:SLAP domain-containing protein [Lactobacillus sp.]MDN6052987.1 SLAP domain-containing protein [Lactobacillus sp.]